MEGVTIARVFKTACELLRGRYCSRHTVIRPTFVPRFHKRNQTFRVVENVRSWANKRMIDNEPATRIVFRCERRGPSRMYQNDRETSSFHSFSCPKRDVPFPRFTLPLSNSLPDFSPFLFHKTIHIFPPVVGPNAAPAGNGISGVTLCRLKSDKKKRERRRVDESERERGAPGTLTNRRKMRTRNSRGAVPRVRCSSFLTCI